MFGAVVRVACDAQTLPLAPRIILNLVHALRQEAGRPDHIRNEHNSLLKRGGKFTKGRNPRLGEQTVVAIGCLQPELTKGGRI